jgi:hypothetical protein
MLFLAEKKQLDCLKLSRQYAIKPEAPQKTKPVEVAKPAASAKPTKPVEAAKAATSEADKIRAQIAALQAQLEAAEAPKSKKAEVPETEEKDEPGETRDEELARLLAEQKADEEDENYIESSNKGYRDSEEEEDEELVDPDKISPRVSYDPYSGYGERRSEDEE